MNKIDQLIEQAKELAHKANFDLEVLEIMKQNGEFADEGDSWTCEQCKREFPIDSTNGCADEYFELCDECWDKTVKREMKK